MRQHVIGEHDFVTVGVVSVDNEWLAFSLLIRVSRVAEVEGLMFLRFFLVQQPMQEGEALPAKQPLLLSRQLLVIVVDAPEKLKVSRIFVGLEGVWARGVREAQLRLHRQLQRRAGRTAQREPGVGDERLQVGLGGRFGRRSRAARRLHVQEQRRVRVSRRPPET